MKKAILILMPLCFTPVIASPTLVSFDKAKHQAEAARIFKQHFKSPPFAELMTSGITTIKICMNDNKVIGVMAYQTKDPLNPTNRHLYYFAIDTQFQSKGYGTACMEQFEKQSKSEGIKTIKLDPSDDTSIKDPSVFFKKLNYAPVSARSTTLSKILQ